MEDVMRLNINMMNINHGDVVSKCGKRQLTDASKPKTRANKPFSRTPAELVDELNCYLGVYAEEVHKTHRENEEKQWQEKKMDPFPHQSDVNQQHRAVLIDWLIEVTEEYSLSVETLFLTVNYVDRVLEVIPMSCPRLQLLGVSCMLLACKYEEIHPPVVDDFVYITDNTYTRAQVLESEHLVLSTLKFSLTVSTIQNFLPRFLLAAEVADRQLLHHCTYLAELTLPILSIQRGYLPSQIAAAIVCLSKSSFNLPPWSLMFESYTGYSKNDLRPCIRDIYQLHETVVLAQLGKCTAAREIFRNEKYCCVSTRPLSPTILAL